MLQLPAAQASMHLHKLGLPAVVLDLPLSRHFAARPCVVVVSKELFETLSDLVANQRDPFLNQTILLLIRLHVDLLLL